ncbi:MAG: metallophosphoesterase, partial [Verrucomicrobiales bacterium]
MRKPSYQRLILLLMFGGTMACLGNEALPQRQSALTLLQINDVYIAKPKEGQKSGGLARVATLKKRFQSEGRSVELILCGDFLSPSIASSIFKGRQMIEAFNAAGVDIGILGNHEFDFGPDVLRQRLTEAPWKWLVSNVSEESTGRPIGNYPTWMIKDYGGMKVG